MVSGETLVDVLCENYTVKVLEATATPKTVPEIADITGIPKATCYRRVNKLESAGVIEEHDVIISDSYKKTTQYIRCIDGINIEFNDDAASITVSEVDTEIDSEKSSILNKYN